MGEGICGEESEIKKNRRYRESNFKNNNQNICEFNNIKNDKCEFENEFNDTNADRIFQGFENIGNSCYMNSYIQILLHCPNFLKFLKKEENSKNNNYLVYNLIKISEIYNKNYLKQIRKIMEKNYGDFQENKQCDSQDFGNKLIDSIINEIKNQNDCSSISSRISMTKYYDKYIKSEIFMEKLFVLVENKISYKNYSNNIFNFSYDIHLSIPNNKKSIYKLEELLYEKYTNIKIIKFPKILIITIDRTILNMEYNTKDIKYPYNLNMKKYSNNDKKIWYELFALNIKKGNSEDYGHYFCYIKINDIWYLFDDNRVIRQKPENTLGKIVGFFYQIKN